MRRIEDVTLKDGRNLKEVLELHKKWLEDKKDGKKADLSYEDLEMLDMNVKRSNCNTRVEYIREQIKKLNKDA